MDATEVLVKRVEGQLSPRDLFEIANKITDVLRKAGEGGHPLGSFLSRTAVYQAVVKAHNEDRLDAYVCNGEWVGVIIYNVVVPWWTEKKVLVEESVMTLNENIRGFGRIAAERLEELAKGYGCSMIHTGGILSPDDPLVQNLYMRKNGFHFMYPLFVKMLSID